MSFWTAGRVAEALGLPAPARDRIFGRIATDSRTLAAGDLFVALRGDRFDGHAFLDAAATAGAAGAVVDRDVPVPAGLAVFRVPDTLRALGKLARARRDAFTGPVVAVTGTNGKTATKELLRCAFGAHYRVHATAENLNNEIGVPLTLLAMPDDTEALVVEAGASVPGEIARLRDIIHPTIAIVTNVAPGHLEGFGSVAGVLEEKLALVEGAPLALVGSDPPALAAGARRRAQTVRVVGLEEGADVRPTTWTVGSDGRPSFASGEVTVRLPLLGRHQIVNALLALTAAEAAGVPLAAAAGALAAVRLPGGRGELLEAGGRTVLHDAYNANPASLLAALDTVQAMRGTRPLVIVVGTMLELGPQEAAEHARLARVIVDANPTLVGAIGAFEAAFAPHRAALGERLVTADTPDALGRAVAARLAGGELILLKASRGVRLEGALPHLLPEREVPCSTTS